VSTLSPQTPSVEPQIQALETEIRRQEEELAKSARTQKIVYGAIIVLALGYTLILPHFIRKEVEPKQFASTTVSLLQQRLPPPDELVVQGEQILRSNIQNGVQALDERLPELEDALMGQIDAQIDSLATEIRTELVTTVKDAIKIGGSDIKATLALTQDAGSMIALSDKIGASLEKEIGEITSQSTLGKGLEDLTQRVSILANARQLTLKEDAERRVLLYAHHLSLDPTYKDKLIERVVKIADGFSKDLPVPAALDPNDLPGLLEEK
jgi:hypothetical protein